MGSNFRKNKRTLFILGQPALQSDSPSLTEGEKVLFNHLFSLYGISLIVYSDIFALEIQPLLMTNVRPRYISIRQIICLS